MSSLKGTRTLSYLRSSIRQIGLGLESMLLTDVAPLSLDRRFGLVLTVARGRADKLSMHTTTLALVEALLVGVATVRATETIESLKALNRLREHLMGRSMDLPHDSKIDII